MKLMSVLVAAAASMALAGGVLAQPYGTGPGMMGGGYGGAGTGPGMMGGYGGAGPGTGPGPGMMSGYADEAYAGLDLKPEQRKKIADIQEETSKAIFEMQLEARKKIDAVLTKDQREKLRQYPGSR